MARMAPSWMKMSNVLARLVGLAQPMAGENEVARGRHRNELRHSLHQAEDGGPGEHLRRQHVRPPRRAPRTWARSGRPRTPAPWRWRPRASRRIAPGSRRSSTARRPMASTEPTGSRMPFTPSSTTSGSPPARLATTGEPQAIASSAASPNDSVCEGRTKRSLAWSSDATESSRPRKRTSPATPELASLVLGVDPLGTVAHHDQGRGHRPADPREHPHHVLHPLHLTEVGDVGDHLGALGREAAPRRRSGPGRYSAQVDEVGDHPESQLTQPNAR